MRGRRGCYFRKQPCGASNTGDHTKLRDASRGTSATPRQHIPIPIMARSLTLALAFWSSSMEVASFAIAPGARPQFNNVRCAPVAASAAPATAPPVRNKVAFNEAMGKAMKLNPRFIQIPMARSRCQRDAYVDDVGHGDAELSVRGIFAVGYERIFASLPLGGIEEDTAVYVRESMCTALGLDPAR